MEKALGRLRITERMREEATEASHGRGKSCDTAAASLENVPVSDLCEELDLQPTVLYRWQKEFIENGAAAFEQKGRRVHQAEQERIGYLEKKDPDQRRSPGGVDGGAIALTKGSEQEFVGTLSNSGCRRVRCKPSICAIWSAGQGGTKAPLKHLGVDEIYPGKESQVHHRGEQPGNRGAAVVRAGAEEGDAGRILSHAIGSSQRLRIEAACVDTWEPFRLSMEEWAPQCRIVCDKLHIMQHANAAVNEVFPPRSSAKAKECARS